MSTIDRILVTGGIRRKNAAKLPEGRRVKSARLVRANLKTRSVHVVMRYEGNNVNYPNQTPNVLFTAGSLTDNELFLCTETEISIFEYPQIQLVRMVSYPFFQNVHHVVPIDKYVAVTSSGLDMVILLDRQSLRPVSFINVLGKDPWHRFSKDVDYRKVHSTKPHESHPNFTFSLNGEIWVTRFNQKDAMCLTRRGKRINIGVERVHDGQVHGDFIYFTTVNGCIVIASARTLRIEEIIGLNAIESLKQPLGWCRGLTVEGDLACVGFSKLRDTPIRQNIKWALDFAKGKKLLRTRCVVYDLRRKKKIHELVMPSRAIDVIYGILREP